MSAEQALEKLRWMLFDVESVDSEISDELCDLLIDIDEDLSKADKIREKKLGDIEKAEKRNQRLREAGQKAAAKRKAEAEAKKAAAKKAPATRSRAKKKDEEAPVETPPAETEEPEAEAHHYAEILPPEPVAPPEAAETETAHPPKKKEPTDGVSIAIGAIHEQEEPAVEFVRADGTHVEVEEVAENLVVEPPVASVVEEDHPGRGLLAEAERRQEEEAQRRAKAAAARPLPKPDPAVVEEVKRKAAERAAQRQLGQAPGGPPRMGQMQQGLRGAAPGAGPVPAKGAPVVGKKREAPDFATIDSRAEEQERRRVVPTGKTARKRMKRVEKMRAEETMRREAAAAVKEYQSGLMGGRKRRHHRSREESGADAEVVQEAMVLEVEDGMTVERLAGAMDMPVNDLILSLMDHDILATKNQTLTLDLIRQLAEEQGFEVRAVIPEETEALAEEPDEPADLVPRAPVITVMGHVDHGKTTLLDRIRASNVAEGEAGGITQHIAAYSVQLGEKRVVFLDTPGHEAFTQMRARGSKVTDIVVLVVAADDGVMPQTIEAIDHARAAEVPIVVAINKIDKPEAQPDRIRQELTRFELLDEQWGGKTIMKEISAKHSQGIDELIELLVLQAELLELKGNPKKRARGTIVESEISKGQGPVAWVLVQNGTLRVGDAFLAGQSFGRVRTMLNSRGESINEAGPATPVVVTGFSAPPDAGDVFVVVADERVARSIAAKRTILNRQKQGAPVRHMTLEDFHERMLAGGRHELNVVLKADVQGSVDVFESSLSKVGNEEAKVRLVHGGIGGINESDVLLASASDAVIIGFHVTANPRALKLAEQEGVDIRTYRVIYEAIEDVRRALEGMLTPDSKETITGHVEIRAVFRSSSLGNIAGCFVQDGEITRSSLVRVVRDGAIVYEGKIDSLRREKDDVRAVQTGFECGIKLDKYEDIKSGDIIEVYKIEQVAKTLA